VSGREGGGGGRRKEKSAISGFDLCKYTERRLRAQYPNEEEFLRESFVISDPLQPDNPLIYVNDGFEKLTLYPAEEIIGKNCRFLQVQKKNNHHIFLKLRKSKNI
jgi:hypothetical protein